MNGSRMGAIIREARLKKGMTEKQLAKKVGMAENVIKAIEMGTRIVSDDQSQRIMKALGAEGSVTPMSAELCAQVMENYETNILSIAREHPETEFMFVFPPGNAFFWDYVCRNGEYTCYMDGLEMVMREMLTLPNVQVYAFADDPDKTMDLDRFKDRVHFDPAMMSEIISDVAAGEGRITAENIDVRMAEMRAYWQKVDFDALYEGYETEEEAK